MTRLSILAVLALTTACSYEGRLGDEEDGGGSTSGHDDGGSGSSCVSDVPCTTDLQCLSLEGHVCQKDEISNAHLDAPVCVKLRCAEAGQPCTADTHCTVGNVCRKLDHEGQRVCDSEEFSVADCLRSCAASTRTWLEYEGWDDRCGPVFDAGCQAICNNQGQVCSPVREIDSAACDLSSATPRVTFTVDCFYMTDHYTQGAEEDDEEP